LLFVAIFTKSAIFDLVQQGLKFIPISTYFQKYVKTVGLTAVSWDFVLQLEAAAKGRRDEEQS
jgi:hypothetical protein